MDLNILSKYVNNNGQVTNLQSTNQEEKSNVINLHNAFSEELNKFKENGFDSKIDAYKNAATGVTTVAIGLSHEGLDDQYVLVKNEWEDNKWNMNILYDKNNGTNSNNLSTSLLFASHGITSANTNQSRIEGLTIEEILKLCE